MAAPGGFAQTKDVYGVVKGESFLQVTDSIRVPDPERAAYWQAWAKHAVSVPEINVAIETPIGTEVYLEPRIGADGAEILEGFEAMVECDVSYPAGSYTIRDELSPSNVRKLTLTLPDAGYPPAPELLNLTTTIMQSKEPLALSWKPLSGAAGADRIFITVEDPIENSVIFRSPFPGESGALPGTASQFTVPPLEIANQFVFVSVSFIRVNTGGSVDTGHASGTAGLAATTRVFVPVLPEPPEEPDVEEFRILDGFVSWQTETGSSPAPENKYLFEAAVIAPPSTELTGIHVQTPAGTIHELEGAHFTEFWRMQLLFENQSELRATALNGRYQWNFAFENKSPLSAELTASFSDVWPAAPRILNVDQLQTGDFTGPFALRWEPLPGGTEADLIEVTIGNSGGGIFWQSPKGFGLSLLSNVSAGGIPQQGTNLVYLAKDSSNLIYFRIFDAKGEMILDDREENFPPGEVAALKEQLAGLWGQAKLTSEQKESILKSVIQLVGLNPEHFPLALTGTSTHLTIPDGVIIPGNSYEGRVRLIRVVSRNPTALEDAVGVVGQFAETRFPIATRSAVALVVLTDDLPPAEVGEYYQGFLNALGGRRPYSWSLLAGELPRGLQFESGGRISGIPAATGNSTLRFAVQDSTGKEAQVTLLLSSTGTIPPLEFLDEPLPGLVPGIAYFAEFALAGGVEPYKVSVVSGRLPEGLALEDCCGFIAGKPLEAGDFNFELELEDGAGQTQRRIFALQVPAEALEPPLRFTAIHSIGLSGVVPALSGRTGDPIAIESSTDMINWKTLIQENLPAGRMFNIPLGQGESQFLRARLGFDRPPSNPLLVTPVLSDVLAVSGELNISGLTLKLTNDLGIIITLDIPKDAVMQPVQVTMTGLNRLDGSPLDEILWGVELKPEGLNLLYPGKLTAKFPSDSPAAAVPFAYAGGGRDCRMHPAFYNGSEVILPIHHFSGYGQGQGDQASQQMQNHRACEPLYAGAQAVAELLNKYKPVMPPQDELQVAMNNWYNQSAYPNLRAAEQNDKLLESALREFLAWARYTQLLGLGEGFNESNMASMERGILNAINRAQARCTSNYDPEEASNILGWARQGQLLGIGESLNSEEIGERIRRCYRFELKLDSVIREASERFVEQVVSSSAFFEWDWTTLKLTRVTPGKLERKHWYLKSDRPTRAEGAIGKLQPGYLRIHFELEKEATIDPKDPCKQLAPPQFKADIWCTFAVEDPVTGFWTLGEDGNWYLNSLQGDMGGRWYGAFKAAHGDEFGKVPAGLDPDGGIIMKDGFAINDKWEFLGKRIYAKADYARPFPFSGGEYLETTVIELWHAPKPFRRSR